MMVQYAEYVEVMLNEIRKAHENRERVIINKWAKIWDETMFKIPDKIVENKQYHSILCVTCPHCFNVQGIIIDNRKQEKTDTCICCQKQLLSPYQIRNTNDNRQQNQPDIPVL